MAAARKTTRAKKTSTTEKTILDQFLAELDRKIDTGKGGSISKSQILIERMVNKALKGDQRMLASVLKLIEKLSSIKEEAKPEEERQSRQDWESIFAFYGKYKALIEEELERLKKANPAYWTFDWFRPTLETAPWYEDMHGKE